jgi:sulfite exporter TauE/SafE
MTELVGVAVVTGVLGSIHCAAMCGPLAAAGGRPVAYLAGRLVSYAALGALFGLIGEHALCHLPVETVQTVAALLVGAFAVWKAVTVARRPRPAPALQLGRRRVPLLARVLSLLPRRGFGLGLATGFLPCGMLIPAWTLAMGSGGAPAGAAVMAAFWLGTSPGLLAPLVAARLARGLLARVPRAVQGAAWAALALWVLARPLLSAVHAH